MMMISQPGGASSICDRDESPRLVPARFDGWLFLATFHPCAMTHGMAPRSTGARRDTVAFIATRRDI